ncbi:hypothetical protein KOW79_006745 [Hemibagrus wyckioides]|uniref:Ubiquitin carboxyl-terminal hydrolase n=1 Tax=Hemibagrus wyckioides TaxID=337641 RepID=A0A9D3P0A3_9TELE|nr:hypothetical protein KOW79_006745 [Hemibagrus wyckioides]
MFSCQCIWRKKTQESPPVSVTSSERSTKATEMSQTKQESTKKKQGGARKISRRCFQKKSKMSASASVKTSERSTKATKTSQTKQVSTKKKQGGARKISRRCFQKSKTSASASVKTSESTSESSEETPRMVLLKLLAGSTPGKNPKANMKTTASSTKKNAERKEASVKPKPSGMKPKEVKKAEVQPNLQNLVMITALTTDKKNTTPREQAKKTAAKTETKNRVNTQKGKTAKISMKPTDKLPTDKEHRIPTDLKRSFQTSVKSKVMEDKKKVMLHEHERQLERMAQYYWQSEMEKFLQEMKELALDVQQEKRITDPDAFSSKKMMPEAKTKSTTTDPCDGKSQSSASSVKNWASDTFEGTSMTRSHILENEVLPGGLPNFGNNCYINASLQCLFTAEAFCEQLCNLLDNSNQTIEDTFIRCFAELSRMRKGSEPRYQTEALLGALIESAAEINPEFTIDNQNDAHEFFCHCLTQMEESGQLQGWQEDAYPRCPVKNNFMFQMRNIITCSSCGSQQQNKVDVFNHISLPLVYNSVEQCLYDAVNKATEIESKCTTCGGKFASSRWTFHTLPKFLVMQLNRFTVTEYYRVVKLNTPMDIQPELQIEACPPQSDTPGTENSKAEVRETGRNHLGGSTSTYRLISVMSHVGSSAQYGHYLSDCYSRSCQQWKTYNDMLVSPITEEDVLTKRSSDAYVLLYERVSTG